MPHRLDVLEDLPADRRRDWEGSDRFEPAIFEILARVLRVPMTAIRQAPFEDDLNDGIDYLVDSPIVQRVGARVRTWPTYFKAYPNQICMRATRSSGARTDHHKVMSDTGERFYIYSHGHMIDGVPVIHRWTIIDLRVLREVHSRLRRGCDFGDVHLYDGDLRWYDAAVIQAPIVVESNHLRRRTRAELDAHRAEFPRGW